jgi:hypothetical protein
MNKKKLTNNQNNLLIIYTVYLKSFDSFFNFIYYYLPQISYNIQNTGIYYKKMNNLALTQLKFNNLNYINMFDSLHDTLGNIITYFSKLKCLFKITIKLYKKNLFDLYLRLFFKLPIKIQNDL